MNNINKKIKKSKKCNKISKTRCSPHSGEMHSDCKISYKNRCIIKQIPQINLKTSNNNLIANHLKNIYHEGFHFPDWSILYSLKYFNTTTTRLLYLYKPEEHKDIVKKNASLLLQQREPCNISMTRLYNQSKMKKTFGWNKGAYQYSTKKQLMPNIAISCEATIKHPYIKDVYKKNVPVINLIGFALDDEKQPDYIFLQNMDINERFQFIRSFYYNMWRLAIIEAKTRKLDKLIYWYVGAGAFSGYDIPGGGIGKLVKELTSKKNFISMLKKELHRARDSEAYNITLIDGEDIMFVPNCIFDNNTSDTLYVNAWDPWSFVGNGNIMDESLDGYWGRSSDMALRCWSGTNKFIKIKSVKWKK